MASLLYRVLLICGFPGCSLMGLPGFGSSPCVGFPYSWSGWWGICCSRCLLCSLACYVCAFSSWFFPVWGIAHLWCWACCLPVWGYGLGVEYDGEGKVWLSGMGGV